MMDQLPEISNKWAFLAFALFQVFQLVKSHLDTKSANSKAEELTAKAKADIEEQRHVTAQKRDRDYALLAQRVEQLEVSQHDITCIIGKMDDRLRDISEGVAYIKGSLIKHQN